MNPPPFESFPKIARLSREVIVTEKIDGTNAQVLDDIKESIAEFAHWRRAFGVLLPSERHAHCPGCGACPTDEDCKCDKAYEEKADRR